MSYVQAKFTRAQNDEEAEEAGRTGGRSRGAGRREEKEERGEEEGGEGGNEGGRYREGKRNPEAAPGKRKEKWERERDRP